jgi:lysine-specific demethylase/histidyl-hydroxylase NO66
VEALARCVGDADRFLTDHFRRRPLLRRHEREAFTDLLSLADVDHLVTSAGLRTPAIRLVNGGTPVPPSRYTASATIAGVPMPGIAAPRKLLTEFDAGATIVLQGLHRYWMPLRRFCRDLELALGHPCQVNAYLTPAGAQGLAQHRDGHDVFVLQIFGTKQWEVHVADESEPWDLVLEPGDALYMPAGTPHSARAEDAMSGHLTVGVLAATWRGLLETVVGTALDDPAFEGALPPGWTRDHDAFATALKEHLELLVDRLAKTGTAEIAADRTDAYLTERHPVIDGAFAARLGLDAIDDQTVVRVRPGAVAELRTGEDRLRLLIGDLELRMPGWLEPALRQLLDGDDHRLTDVAGIDADSRLVLIRRLVREGVLEMAGDRP